MAATSGPIRLSFKTDKPFNPYYVPAENVPAGNKQGLDLYFLAEGEYEGKIGGQEPWIKQDATFSASSDFAVQLKLAPKQVGDQYTVTHFHDYNFPVANKEDLFFSPVPPKAVAQKPSRSYRGLWAYTTAIGLLSAFGTRRLR